MKRPLVGVALCYTIGIALTAFLLPSVPYLVVGAGLLLLGAIADNRRRSPWLAATLVAVGWLAGGLRLLPNNPRDLRLLLGEEPAIVSILGRLDGDPRQRTIARGDAEQTNTITFVDVHDIRRAGGNWQPAVGKIVVFASGRTAPMFHDGTEVELEGVAAQPEQARAPGLFDYRAYLRWQGVHYALQSRSAGSWRLANPSDAHKPPPLSSRFMDWAQQALGTGLPGEDDPLRLVWWMTLGLKTTVTDAVAEPFMRTGTLHLFAISGLHVALLAEVLLLVLETLRVPRFWCGLVAIPTIWFYTVATGSQPSAIRAAVMMSVVAAGWSLNRPGDLLNSLAAAGLAILVWDPMQLFQAGFQLSFAAVLSLALVMPRIETIATARLRPDPWIPEDLVPRWQLVLFGAARKIAKPIALSLACWLGTFPLVAYYFHMVSPVGILVNLVAGPLGSLALVCNLGTLLTAAWLPSAAGLLNHSSWLWMKLLSLVCGAAAHWRWGSFYIPAPSVSWIAMFYLVLAACLAGWLGLRGPWSRARLIAVVLACTLAVGWGWRQQPLGRLTVLNLSRGGSVFMDYPGTENDLLADTGDEKDALRVVRPFLQAQGWNTMPATALTQGDVARVGGALALVKEPGVLDLLTSPATTPSKAYNAAVAAFESGNQRHAARLSRGSRWREWEVVHPGPDIVGGPADAHPLALATSTGGWRILLLSELDPAGQRELATSGQSLRADIIVAGNPVTGEPLIPELLSQTRPRVVILQDAPRPRGRTASDRLVNRLQRSGVAVLPLSRHGTVIVEFRKDRCEARGVDGTVLWSSTNDTR